MACFKPLKGFYATTVNPSGKRSIVFSEKEGYIDRPVELPCGQCIGCRISKQQQWAIRCVHESMMHTWNWFVTLTYAPEHLPENLSVSKDAHQKFMKRLRKQTGQQFRYYMCAEYGGLNGRPHYHYLLFGLRLDDLQLWRLSKSRSGELNRIYRSPVIEKAWPYGYCEVGEVSYSSAAYTAGYIRKKITSKGQNQVDPETGLTPYELICKKTGDLISREPEFSHMSRNPGLGKAFYEKYKRQIINNDYVVVNDKRMRVPKYYDYLCQEADKQLLDENKRKRREAAKKYAPELSPERLRARETYLENIAGRKTLYGHIN